MIKIPQQSARVANLHNLDHFLVNKNERCYDWTQCLLKWFSHFRERLSYFDPATLKVFLFFKEKFQYFKIMQNLIRFRPTNQRSFSNRRYSGDQTRLDFLSTLAMIWFFTSDISWRKKWHSNKISILPKTNSGVPFFCQSKQQEMKISVQKYFTIYCLLGSICRCISLGDSSLVVSQFRKDVNSRVKPKNFKSKHDQIFG